ncbi:MAG: DUF58 domain-containing protein [Nanoarchaeota archaeon]
MNKKLNVDYSSAITELESILNKYVPKRLYMKIFRGKGLEFDRYRKYEPDDDARLIDWKASLRTNQILAKQYIEERNLNILFVVDVGENMVFGSSKKLKCEYSAEMTAAMMHLISSYNDNFGLILFSDKIKKYIGPDKGENHFNFLTDMLSNSDYYGGNTNFEIVLDFLLDQVEDIDGIFFLSDFLHFSKKLKEKFDLVSEKFEVTSLMIQDPLDISLPDKNMEIIIEDYRNHEQIVINPKRIKKEYEKLSSQKFEEVKLVFENSNADLFQIKTDQDFALELATFLNERAGKEQEMVLGS